MTRRRKASDRHHALAAEGVRAYVRDEDADLYNITDAAVREDAMVAAWNLTALAAALATSLAECRGVTPEAALDEVVAEGYGGLVRRQRRARSTRPAEEEGPAEPV